MRTTRTREIFYLAHRRLPTTEPCQGLVQHSSFRCVHHYLSRHSAEPAAGGQLQDEEIQQQRSAGTSCSRRRFFLTKKVTQRQQCTPSESYKNLIRNMCIVTTHQSRPWPIAKPKSGRARQERCQRSKTERPLKKKRRVASRSAHTCGGNRRYRATRETK